MKNPAVPKAFGTRYLIVRSYYFHIRSLTPQQAARNALAVRFKDSSKFRRFSKFVIPAWPESFFALFS